MLRNLAQYVCSAGLAAAALLAPVVQAAEPGLRLVVAIRDYTRMPRETLDAAEAQASRIFDQAGLKIEWWELPVSAESRELPPASQPVAPPAAYVKLVQYPKVTALRRSAGALGCTGGDQVYVFPDRIRQAAGQARTDYASTLGHVMVHEIGHALLGKDSHSPSGIMSSGFGGPEFLAINGGRLLFTGAEADEMRERLLARQAAESAALAAQR